PPCSPSVPYTTLFLSLSFRPLCFGLNDLLEVLVLLTAVIVTDPRLDFRGRQQPLRLGDGLLAMQPARLDRVEPRALTRQLADHRSEERRVGKEGRDGW